MALPEPPVVVAGASAVVVVAAVGAGVGAAVVAEVLVPVVVLQQLSWAQPPKNSERQGATSRFVPPLAHVRELHAKVQHRLSSQMPPLVLMLHCTAEGLPTSVFPCVLHVWSAQVPAAVAAVPSVVPPVVPPVVSLAVSPAVPPVVPPVVSPVVSPVVPPVVPPVVAALSVQQ